MYRKGRRVANGAFTLIEVIVAIIVFGIVAIGGMSFFMYGRTHINYAANSRLGLELARQKMEIIKATSYSNIASATENSISVGDFTARRITTVTAISDANGPRKEVNVRVRWPAAQPAEEVNLYTLIAEP